MRAAEERVSFFSSSIDACVRNENMKSGSEAVQAECYE